MLYELRGVAQFGRALRSGRRGRVFESRHPDFSLLKAQALCLRLIFFKYYGTIKREYISSPFQLSGKKRMFFCHCILNKYFSDTRMMFPSMNIFFPEYKYSPFTDFILLHKTLPNRYFDCKSSHFFKKNDKFILFFYYILINRISFCGKSFFVFRHYIVFHHFHVMMKVISYLL